MDKLFNFISCLTTTKFVWGVSVVFASALDFRNI